MSLAVLERVSYWYPSSPGPALSDVSLAVEPGELVVLAGDSGCGKSTLLRSLNGLVPHFHGGRFSGSVRVAELDTRGHGPGELAAVVGTLFQDPETQVVMGTVRAEIALALENLGQPPTVVARGVQEAALALGITHLLERSTGELSGGELQRVALAAALATKPALLLLDEPTSQLDPVSGDELIATLRRLNEDRDTAIVLAEHRLERCLGFADRVVALDGGRVVCDAPPAEFLSWAVESAPELATPGATLLHRLGLRPVPGVRPARALLRKRSLSPAQSEAPGANEGQTIPVANGGEAVPAANGGQTARATKGARTSASDSIRVTGVWHELWKGRAILRDISLRVAAGERVALMGANGAGKSTLLRHLAGLLKPTRGRIERAGRVALLLQNPTDYLVHERVAEEASAGALRAAGLDPEAFGRRHPREISVGEKQRVALAVVLGDADAEPPSVVCLDEPTRGLDRGLKTALAGLLRTLDASVIVATHDPEFVSRFADRVLLLGEGRLIADGPAREVLATGTYFATETARILGGAGGALTPEEGAALLSADPAPAGDGQLAEVSR